MYHNLWEKNPDICMSWKTFSYFLEFNHKTQTFLFCAILSHRHYTLASLPSNRSCSIHSSLDQIHQLESLYLLLSLHPSFPLSPPHQSVVVTGPSSSTQRKYSYWQPLRCWAFAEIWLDFAAPGKFRCNSRINKQPQIFSKC